MDKASELATALRDLLREVRKINDVLLPDGFDARAVRHAQTALAAYDALGVIVPPGLNSKSVTGD